MCPSPLLCLNTCIHTNPPPPHGHVLSRQVRVRPLIFIPHKYTCSCLSIYWNSPLLQNPHPCHPISIKPSPQGGAGSRFRSGARKTVVSGVASFFRDTDWLVAVSWALQFISLVFNFSVPFFYLNVFSFCEVSTSNVFFLKTKISKVTWTASFKIGRSCS